VAIDRNAALNSINLAVQLKTVKACRHQKNGHRSGWFYAEHSWWYHIREKNNKKNISLKVHSFFHQGYRTSFNNTLFREEKKSFHPIINDFKKKHKMIKLDIRFIPVVNPLVFKGCLFIVTVIAHLGFIILHVIELDF
jgi:hypothetical protein